MSEVTAGGRGRPWSLRTRLVVSAVLLIAVVCAVIGTVTTVAFRTYLYGQLDAQLGAVAMRATGPPLPDGERPPVGLPRKTPLDFVTGGGAPVGTVGALVGDDGTVTVAVASTQREPDGLGPTEDPLTAAQRDALASVARDGEPHTVELPDGGGYRVEYADGVRGSFLVGVPTRDVQDALRTLILVEVCVTGAGLLAAGIAGASIVGVALRPLRRVAATARRVSELPLHSGEVALHERVPDAEADPRTEVGQVGAALNMLLGHVGSALSARQESETRVRRFVADAGHELRTPLASIRGYAELTRRGRERNEVEATPGGRPGGRDAVPPDTRHALSRIESEAVRMTGLVEDLLLLARLDAGRPLAHESTDLPRLVVDAVSDARAAGPDHTWRLELPAEPVTVRADRERLHQVLVNLLANARTHTPPGTTVTARVRAGDPPAGPVLLEVEDDGPGIPEEFQRSVFERFARGDASRSRQAGGTGLGLAIAHAVVTAHGGTVGVRSVPGRTVFTVALPPARAGAGPAEEVPQDSQAGHRLITQP
ncbi:HAMP domain-containing sensor histidine kinase [Streptomyces sp. PKU-EA00015]|uniref:sensor histidine kinase n=1 Tax=Streptomyces sp. PKU-EA00015 TaxID=2748326 RepID=UPI002811EA36|nr:HAMP domain-containing sensor histidine kinase [Streptomyces sp. PKU-EA00015]